MSDRINHWLRIGPALFNATRALSGSWEIDGHPLPWVSYQPWDGSSNGGGSVLIGAWRLSVMWDRAK